MSTKNSWDFGLAFLRLKYIEALTRTKRTITNKQLVDDMKKFTERMNTAKVGE